EPHLLPYSPSSISFNTPNCSAHYAGEHQLFASQSDVHLAAQSSIAMATSDGASSLYPTDDGTKIMANHGSVSLQAREGALAPQADKDANITSAGSSIEVLDVSVQIMMLGMKDGLFRSEHTLSKCLDDEDDYFNARLIINGINNGIPDKKISSRTMPYVFRKLSMK